MRISDWSSDVCSSDLHCRGRRQHARGQRRTVRFDQKRGIGIFGGIEDATDQATENQRFRRSAKRKSLAQPTVVMPDFTQHHGMNNSLLAFEMAIDMRSDNAHFAGDIHDPGTGDRSEEHTSELQSLMRISYAVFCLKKKKTKYTYNNTRHNSTT